MTRPSPQLHLTLSAFHPCSLLSTLSAPNILFRRGMRVLSGDGTVEGWRGGEKRKSCGEEKREGENPKQWITQRMWINTIDVSFYLVSIFDHILHTPPFIPPSLHPRSSLAPPSHHPSITFTQPLQPYPPLPPTLPPTPFHLDSRPTSLPFRVFLLCRRREGKARSCGEATRQGVENPKRWDRHWHLQERNEKHTLYIACETKCLGPPDAL